MVILRLKHSSTSWASVPKGKAKKWQLQAKILGIYGISKFNLSVIRGLYKKINA
jgi:hypothetical protein